MINLDNINKDFYYSKLYRQYGEEYVKQAGYFETKTKDNCLSDDELKETLKLPCTSLRSREEYNVENACVLLSTGCFNPVHFSHLTMMRTARKELIKHGYNVVQSFLAPDSDTYCITKGEYYSFPIRASKIKEKAQELEINVDVDYFPLSLNRDINFTTIYRRLELYIEHFIGRRIPIFYVCGSDRANFSFTFEDKAIVVERHGYENKETHPKSIYIKPFVPLRDSSTEIRINGLSHPEKKELIIRTDKHSQDYLSIFDEYFSKIHINNFKEKLKPNTISLDSMTSSKYNLKLSRLYNLGGINKLGFTNRPYSKSLNIQVNRIPKGDYYLFDDDTFTGSTFKFTTKLLEKSGINILGYKTLVKSSKHYEVLDARDFRFGLNSGLCVRFPDEQVFRVPYLFPFVDLYERASILKPIEFSLEIWNYLANLEDAKDISLREAPVGRVYIKLGFDPNTTLSEVAKYYANVCRNTQVSC